MKQAFEKGRHLVPEGYHPVLNHMQTQEAIAVLKTVFARELCVALNLTRVSAPLFVAGDSGLNDDLSGIERKVTFDPLEQPGVRLEVVQSLAKWKRMALHRYGAHAGRGIYTDMDAIRRDEITDNLHSIYVDQWDWELVIEREQRTPEFLKDTVRRIHNAVRAAERAMVGAFPELTMGIAEEVVFVTSQELEDAYPDMTPTQRELAFTREHRVVFVMQIGWPLTSGKSHDMRAPDYDDWLLNGDLLYYSPVLDCAMEMSSMGIRVDPAAMDQQLRAAGRDERRSLPFHKALLAGQLPLTIGGGIGQSRLSMLLLGKAHIGEVHCAVWPPEVIEAFAQGGIMLL